MSAVNHAIAVLVIACAVLGAVVVFVSAACTSQSAVPFRTAPEIRCAQQGGSWTPIYGEAGTVIGHRCEATPR